VQAERADFDAWIAALWPAEGLEGLFGVFERLRGLARERHVGPYRFPLVRELPARDQVVAWTSLLGTLGVLAEDEIPSVFFPPPSLAPSSDAAHAVIAGRPLSADEVVWLTVADDHALGPADFAQSGEAASSSAAASTSGRARLSESLRGALASFGARSR
jgi:hypothetical protein